MDEWEKFNHFNIREFGNEGKEIVATTPYKTKFIYSVRLMTCFLSNLADNLAEGIHKIRCKYCDCFLEYESVKNNLIKYKYLSCNKDYSKRLDEELQK